jgi:hypothetical protein
MVFFYGGSKWGGSFWHHNPHDETIKEIFARRTARIMSKDGAVSADTPRVFLHSCNASSDVLLAPKLYSALQKMLPDAKIYLLIFIDNQDLQGPQRLVGDQCGNGNVIFYRLGAEIFANTGKLWTEQKHSEMYAQGTAAAVRAWSGTGTDLEKIPAVSDLASFESQLCQYNGGDPSKDLYWPARKQTTNLSIAPRTALEAMSVAAAPNTQQIASPDTTPTAVATMSGYVQPSFQTPTSPVARGNYMQSVSRGSSMTTRQIGGRPSSGYNSTTVPRASSCTQATHSLAQKCRLRQMQTLSSQGDYGGASPTTGNYGFPLQGISLGTALIPQNRTNNAGLQGSVAIPMQYTL